MVVFSNEVCSTFTTMILRTLLSDHIQHSGTALSTDSRLHTTSYNNVIETYCLHCRSWTYFSSRRWDYITPGGRLQGAEKGMDTCKGGDCTSWMGKRTEQFPPTFLQSHLQSSCFAHKYVVAVLIFYTFCATYVHKRVYNKQTAQKFLLIHI
jgi:hypothetical protein